MDQVYSQNMIITIISVNGTTNIMKSLTVTPFYKANVKMALGMSTYKEQMVTECPEFELILSVDYIINMSVSRPSIKKIGER